ncbi:BglG family transcription antiterminator [Streptococcus halotolerans]|uniref:BglG family transcription antiterminator n=1 Tax=Streptococcus halotolerans TaxID=1814128 RepID=UPI000789400F|nr:PRD domain-containing protein [Streptococcus halotolerans]
MAIIKRWYKILNFLVSQTQVSLQEMKKELNVSQKTLLSSIEQLNAVLDDDIRIKNEHNQLSLQVFDYNRLEEILSGSLKKESDFNSSSKRISYIIKKLMQHPEPTLIDDLAAEINVSRTTINKDLRKVKELAKHYQVDIFGTPNRGISINGDEMQLRLFYCYNVYPYFDTTILKTDTKHFLSELYERYQLPRKTQDLLSKVIAISLMRIKSSSFLEGIIPYFNNQLKQSNILEELVYHIEITYQISLNQIERDFLSFPLHLQYIATLNYQEIPSDLISTIFQQMMERINDSFDLEINTEKLFRDLHTHLKFLLNRLRFYCQTSDLFQGEIKNKYPLAYQLARKAGTVLEELFQNELESSEISYLALYFEMELREANTVHLTQKRQIAVVCTTGRGTATMINHQLRRVLGNEIVIDQYSEENFKPNQAEHYSAIFTTIPLKFQHISTPVIQITNLFNDQWLRNQWEQVNQWEQKSFQSTQFQFIRLSPKEYYFDYLIEMADKLVKETPIDSTFTHKIITREKKQSTIFGNNIAFPHATHSKQQIILMVGVLEETYITSSESVDFIFMLAIPEKSTQKIETELLALYDDIFRIANDTELKSNLKQIETDEDFSIFIQNKGVLR